jgi:hypothetical protein
MPYKFKRYKIKWDIKKRKFKKIKKDRKKSREAYQRFRKNRGKMLAVLRKNRKKIKRKAARNRNAGIEQKLAKARNKYKHLLNNSLEYSIDNILFESKEMEPEVEIGEDDLKELDKALSDIKLSVDIDDKEEQEEFDQYIEDSKALVKSIIDNGDEGSNNHDEDAVSEILKFVDTFFKLEKSEGDN